MAGVGGLVRLLTRPDPRFDVVFTVACAISIGGLFLDGWAHNNAKVANDDFFTPYHYVLYGGTGLAALLLIFAGWARRHDGRQRGNNTFERVMNVLPTGYGIAALGVTIYIIGGILDLGWHTIFGVEANVEALFSPSHLLLLLGALLYRTGPLRAAWARDPVAGPGGWQLMPMVLSATFALGSLQFFTQYVHPFGLTAIASDFQPSRTVPVTPHGSQLMPALFQDGEATQYVVGIGVASVIVQAALMTGVVLFLVERWGPRLPPITFTLMLGLTTMAVVWMRSAYLSVDAVLMAGVGFLAGICIDLLNAVLKPGRFGGPEAPSWLQGQRAFRLFAFAAPAILTALYVATLSLTAGFWVKAHVFLGLPLVAGGVGWLMSWVVLQPPPPHLSPPETRPA